MSSGIYRLLSFVSANRNSYLSQRGMESQECQAVYEPSVLLIVAGGTICMQDSEDGLVTSKLFLDSCLAPKPLFNDGTPIPTSPVIDEHGIPREAPSLRLPRDRNGANVRCTVLEFNPLLDSSTAHSPTWNQLARTVSSNEANYDAFVICHGTDTLAYTSAALSFMLMPSLEKTVVLTGAQRSMFFADSDGSDNLLGSIVLASHLKIPEVCVYFGHKLLRGTRITKISASSYSGFESPNAGPLATVSETGIVVHWDNLQHPEESVIAKAKERKAIVEIDSSKVVVLKVYPGITPSVVEAILSPQHIQGAVLETFGAGNLPLDILPALSKAVQRGVVIVNVTQCLHGSVSDAYEPARKLVEAGIMLGYDMTSEAAYTKMVYLLACKELSSGEVSKQMSSNIRGELTPPQAPVSGGPLSIAQLPIRYERTMPSHLSFDFGSHQASRL
ncbi:60 kDa lysophospholipase [Lecanosticta acicola]|uniref:asparaginase n=1 Tax=Lecanosticta acicola TaxID=111012 RepID=A0AAI8YUA2_9PEZI|nr:60 kDa lysophospholipase [Lecanosticta acicola]